MNGDHELARRDFRKQPVAAMLVELLDPFVYKVQCITKDRVWKGVCMILLLDRLEAIYLSLLHYTKTHVHICCIL